MSSAPFGIMIPGQLSVTEFTILNNYYTLDVPNHSTIHSLAFFLLNPL